MWNGMHGSEACDPQLGVERARKGEPVTRIVDLTLKIGEETLSPPSVNKRLELTSHHRGPGFWQASEINMLLHTGSHVDFGRHCAQDGETAADVSLDRTCGPAIVIDLTFLGEDEPITVDLLEQHAPPIHDGDVALCRTDWTEKAWGRFPDYYMRSPYCEPEAAGWLVDHGAKVVGFDCFSERSAREPDFTSEDFVVHKAILDRGAILIQQLTGLSQLPVGVRVPFFAGFVPIRGAEGSPGRMFALIEEEE
jgi:arylformamidase